MLNLEPKTSTCLYCRESGIKRRYDVNNMKSVDDLHLGCGLICKACWEGAMKEWNREHGIRENA